VTHFKPLLYYKLKRVTKYQFVWDHNHIYVLCSVSLSHFISIQPSILVFVRFYLNFIHFFDCSCTYQFIHCIVYFFLFVCLPCVVLFGLMATILNKHYYYYYYYYYYNYFNYYYYYYSYHLC